MKKNKNFEIGQVVYMYFSDVLPLEEAVVQGFAQGAKGEYIKVKYSFGSNYKIESEVFATRQECIDYANSRHNDRVADFRAKHGTKEGILKWMYDNVGDIDCPFEPEKEVLKELIKAEFGVEV